VTRHAVVLFNLGGPDEPEAVRPFLFNLFNDPAIIGLPQPLRYLLAQLISARRAKVATEIYRQLGGGSPLLANTRAQADALQAELDGQTRVFIAMRYWHPMSDETAAAVKAYAPDRIILLPLYPQFSTTTTASSWRDWARAVRAADLNVPTVTVCCYPAEPGFISALAGLIRPALERARETGRPRVLFSAHGLPKKVVERGDPYQWQVEQSATAVVRALDVPDLDWAVCYQSRVGPLEWIGPYTDVEIERAGRDRVPLVVAPIAFVSEHSETLVELDIDYRARAEQHGVPLYLRIPTVATHPAFIAGLADMVRSTSGSVQESRRPNEGARICPPECGRCFAASAAR
jgi:protoporphyrin/coproporphyrin ferrochelatase